MHVAAVRLPSWQLEGPEMVYPSRHVGSHVVPLASIPVHVPMPPLAGGVLALQGLGMHEAAVKTPREHLEGPETV